MLLPALGKAREKARTTSCINSQKQIGLALLMYANDCDDHLPATLDNDRKTPMTNNGYTVNGGMWYLRLMNAKFLPNNFAISRYSIVNKNFGKAMMCAALNLRETTYNPYNYGMNAYSFPIAGGNSGQTKELSYLYRKTIHIQNPSDRGIISEPFYNSSHSDDGYGVLPNTPDATRHGGTVNFLHVDGHAAGYISTQIQYESQDANISAPWVKTGGTLSYPTRWTE